MALHEQLHLKTILPALQDMSDGFSPDDEEFLLPISINCELEDFLLTEGIHLDALDGDSPTTDFASRRRKRTYELRKDEIDVLDKKAKLLSTKLEFLKHRAGIQDEQSVAQQELNNHMLREVLRNQQFLIAGFRSLMSTDTSETVLSPVSTPIHLESDLAKRRKLLRDIKFQKIHDARRFLERRTQHSPMTTRFSESTRRRTDEGDTIAVRFDIVPLHEAKSIKQVFDAIMFYFAHLEICMTEMLGDVTVREENAERDHSGKEEKKRGIAQHRFLYTNQHNISIETNSVMFSEYKENHRCAYTGDLREDAVVVTDFVDQDDLFPYSPHERMRKDITGILHVQSCERPREAQGASGQWTSPGRGDSEDFTTNLVDAMQEEEAQDGGERVVVLTMWFQMKLRRCEFEIAEDKLLELIEDTDRVHEAILKSVRASLRSVHLE